MLHLKVFGMSCDHCVTAITQAVKAVPGVEDVCVDLAQGDVAIRGAASERAIRDAIAEEGYEVQAAG